MKIALLGYGKMGKEIEQIALRRGHQIVLKVGSKNASTFTDAELKNADVAIEFSVPEYAFPNIQRCFKTNVPVVVGTTGWLDKLEEVRKQCREGEHAFFYASNFSIGVNVFFKVNEFLAKLMNNYPEYEVNMEEIHHIHKKDSPSGTGLSLANGILKNISRKTKWTEGQSNEASVLSIHSRREGEVPGTHIIRYTSSVDDIEISHTAHNRKGFALGSVLAAEWLPGRKGVFGMEDLMGI